MYNFSLIKTTLPRTRRTAWTPPKSRRTSKTSSPRSKTRRDSTQVGTETTTTTKTFVRPCLFCSSGNFEGPGSGLSALCEEAEISKKKMDEEMGLEGSKEETDAAVLIQNKFKALKLRKKSANETATPGEKVLNIHDMVQYFTH